MPLEIPPNEKKQTKKEPSEQQNGNNKLLGAERMKDHGCG